jgi:formylglycine-generating enzyme required for sulfatase activity
LGEKPRPIRELSPDAPDFLLDAVHQAMIIDPRERCQDAFELQRLLQTQKPEPAPVGIRSRERRPLPTETVAALDHNLIYIPAGQFLLGTDDPRLKEACHPQQAVELSAYCIGRCPVTNADYQRFIDNNPNHPVPHSPMRYAQRYNWDPELRTYPRGLEDHPVVLVTWQDALAYCRWLSEVTGYQCRLPTEAEWEKAACWDPEANHARRHPWGDEFDEERCNVDAHGALRLESSPVGQYSPVGDSPYALTDMAGNVWEWTGSLYQPYPYDAGDGREDPGADGDRAVRGGAYDEGPLLARCAWRNGVQPDLRLANVGFRVACEAQ